MKICLVTSEYITEKSKDGGLAKYIHNIATALTKLGHHITIITRSENSYREVENGIIVIGAKPNLRWQKLLHKLSFYRLVGVIDALLSAYAIRKSYINEISEHGSFNVIQTASYHFPGLLIRGQKIIRLSSYEPLWAAMQGDVITLDKYLLFKIEEFEIRHAYKVYAPSKFLANYVSRILHLKVNHIFPPLPAKIWKRNDTSIYQKYLKGREYLLFFGSITKLKGVELIFKSLTALLENTSYTFVFVGKGTDIPLKNKRVIRFQSLNRDQLQPLIDHASAIILPSIVDNLPNTCIEAMASSQIVVGAKGSSLDELIVDESSGYLLKKHTVDELLKIIHKISQLSASKRRIMKAVARKRILELLRENKVIPDLINYYKQSTT